MKPAKDSDSRQPLSDKEKTAEQEAESQMSPVVQGLKAYKEGGKAALAKFLREQEKKYKNRSKT
jgi:hypothetical protein